MYGYILAGWRDNDIVVDYKQVRTLYQLGLIRIEGSYSNGLIWHDIVAKGEKLQGFPEGYGCLGVSAGGRFDTKVLTLKQIRESQTAKMDLIFFCQYWYNNYNYCSHSGFDPHLCYLVTYHLLN